METLSTRQIVIRITVTIAAIELAIMIFFAAVSLEIGLLAEAFLDVILLVLLSTPVIYYWVVKPYVIANKNAISKINHLAHHDPLTNLPNRRLLGLFVEKLIPNVIRHKSHGALLFIDLNEFKSVNDANGHDAGDAVLIETAARLNSVMRADDIASRVGGDEFVIVLGALGIDEQSARDRAMLATRRIQDDLQKPINFNGSELEIKASIGVHIIDPSATSVDNVLREADAAMYYAKKSGQDSALSGESNTDE